MADGFGRVRGKLEMTACDGKVSGDGEFFTGAEAEKSAIVADAEPEAGARLAGCTIADARQKGKLAFSAGSRCH
jgi:hypothetical protein